MVALAAWGQTMPVPFTKCTEMLPARKASLAFSGRTVLTADMRSPNPVSVALSPRHSPPLARSPDSEGAGVRDRNLENAR